MIGHHTPGVIKISAAEAGLATEVQPTSLGLMKRSRIVAVTKALYVLKQRDIGIDEANRIRWGGGVVKEDKRVEFTCLECEERVFAFRASITGVPAHFEHRRDATAPCLYRNK